MDRREDNVYVIPTDGFEADWVKNIRNNGQVRLTLMKQRLAGKAELITDQEERARIARRYDGKWWVRGCFLHSLSRVERALHGGFQRSLWSGFDLATALTIKQTDVLKVCRALGRI